ncbi:hypothetical protein [Pantoea agglomerans]|uniref:Uncharacterized protein n=1 Tax=Enterobacter agglomerans TaxID=549 RepID=A0ACC5PWZ2_ENTAG|nr:hypothetical protein [Pantoea agglomerans]MBD8129157.1 hypothetical protein [Pantoea agglomerans]MBD8154867.1 hypothetical protein [Pantoea agglomerans]MBD8242526.1 hypothetical protein [Pantoea agglomerans]WVL84695.1 hypothetical protein IFU02_019835 [Pantoea agglomerans]
MSELFTYRTSENVLLSAQRLADLLQCANHLMISGDENNGRYVGSLVDIAAEYAQEITNALDMGEVLTTDTEHGVCNDR